MDVKRRKFGLLSDGSKVYLYTVSNGQVEFSATNYGCVITSLIVPSKDRGFQDIVLAPPTFDFLVSSYACFGAFVGRYAGRIGGASFKLNGIEYVLDKNLKGSCLHGGFFRWDKQLWNSEIIENSQGKGIRFFRTSPDGEQGMPGNLEVEVSYMLNTSNELIIHYGAVSDKDTPINFTNHSYFNLKGQGNGTVENHILQMNCSTYLETDDCQVPTGKILPVEKSVFDFRIGKSMGEDLSSSELTATGGYDHCFCINEDFKYSIPFATVFEPETKRTMTVATDMPAVQFYTANGMGKTIGKNGSIYFDHGGFCLETQFFPDSPNKPNFPNCILKSGQRFSSTTIYGFKW